MLEEPMTKHAACTTAQAERAALEVAFDRTPRAHGLSRGVCPSAVAVITGGGFGGCRGLAEPSANERTEAHSWVDEGPQWWTASVLWD